MNTRQFISKTLTNSQLFSEVVVACKGLLRTSEVAAECRKYLDSRVSKHNQNKYDFGFFPPDDKLDELYAQIDRDKLRQLGLIYNINLHDQNNTIFTRSVLNYHNLIWPVKDDYGNIVALIGRSTLDKDRLKELSIAKYKYTKFSKQSVLFGLSQAKKTIRKTGIAIVAEGQLDCVSCHAHGFHNTVALGGTSLGYYQVYLLKKYGAKELWLVLDNDDAGRSGYDKITRKYSGYIDIKKVSLPSQYKDVDEYLRKSEDTGAFYCKAAREPKI